MKGYTLKQTYTHAHTLKLIRGRAWNRCCMQRLEAGRKHLRKIRNKRCLAASAWLERAHGKGATLGAIAAAAVAGADAAVMAAARGRSTRWLMWCSMESRVSSTNMRC
eukprot:scaffold140137_cov19-Tisochrysis_lutea.AAC.1